MKKNFKNPLITRFTKKSYILYVYTAYLYSIKTDNSDLFWVKIPVFYSTHRWSKISSTEQFGFLVNKMMAN